MKKRNHISWIEIGFISGTLVAVYFVFGAPMMAAHREGKIVTSAYYQPMINYNVAQIGEVQY